MEAPIYDEKSEFSYKNSGSYSDKRLYPSVSGPGQRSECSPKTFETRCSRCSSLSFDREWHDTFGITLCAQCRKDEKLISKSTARQKYFVTDSEMKRLGSLRKCNPHKKEWQKMHLYLETQIQEIAYKKYGGPEGIEEHQRKLLDDQLLSRMRKREEDRGKDEREAAKLQRIKDRILIRSVKEPAVIYDVEDI